MLPPNNACLPMKPNNWCWYYLFGAGIVTGYVETAPLQRALHAVRHRYRPSHHFAPGSYAHPGKKTRVLCIILHICFSGGICSDRARASRSKWLISVSTSPLVCVVTQNTDGGANKHHTYLVARCRPAEKAIRLATYEIPVCVLASVCVMRRFSRCPARRLE